MIVDSVLGIAKNPRKEILQSSNGTINTYACVAGMPDCMGFGTEQFFNQLLGNSRKF